MSIFVVVKTVIGACLNPWAPGYIQGTFAAIDGRNGGSGNGNSCGPRTNCLTSWGCRHIVAYDGTPIGAYAEEHTLCIKQGMIHIALEMTDRFGWKTMRYPVTHHMRVLMLQLISLVYMPNALMVRLHLKSSI